MTVTNLPVRRTPAALVHQPPVVAEIEPRAVADPPSAGRRVNRQAAFLLAGVVVALVAAAAIAERLAHQHSAALWLLIAAGIVFTGAALAAADASTVTCANTRGRQ